MIGQTAAIAPADKTLYALRDVTATVESIPLITASILSKKLAEGIDALVMDVKVGRGAFMKTMPDARALATSLVAVGTANGLKTEALITAMEHPLGRAVGNSLEVIEMHRNAERKRAERPGNAFGRARRPHDPAWRAWRTTDAASRAENSPRPRFRRRPGKIPCDGRASKRAITAIVDDYSRLPAAPHRHVVKADRHGFVADLHAEWIGHGAMILGAGRHHAEDSVDHAVGVYIHAPVGTQVGPGDDILEIHYRDEGKLHSAALVYESPADRERPPPAEPLIHETITANSTATCSRIRQNSGSSISRNPNSGEFGYKRVVIRKEIMSEMLDTRLWEAAKAGTRTCPCALFQLQGRGRAGDERRRNRSAAATSRTPPMG